VAHISRHAQVFFIGAHTGNEIGSSECSSSITSCTGGEYKDTAMLKCMSRRKSSKEKLTWRMGGSPRLLCLGFVAKQVMRGIRA
jgi:hypothetical protein